MKIKPSVMVEVQRACPDEGLPSDGQFTQWAALAMTSEHQASVVIRLVEKDESAELNQTYRQKSGMTNVLSFPFEKPEGLPEEALENLFLGDIVICASLVAKEACEQHKLLHHHWAHLVIHGCLHLQGYDHVQEKQAVEMEALEVDLLKQIDIANPYAGLQDNE
jgi:probable rRNA maturation factor